MTEAKTMMRLEALTPDPANARRHSRRNLDAIKASLARWGQRKPVVVDAAGKILAGNGTLEAARELGWTELWVAPCELEGVEATAYAIADNRTGELATWDGEGLAKTLDGIRRVDAEAFGSSGFGEKEFGQMVPALDRIDLLTGADGDKPAAHKRQIVVTFWEHDEPAVTEALEQLRRKVPGVHYVS